MDLDLLAKILEKAPILLLAFFGWLGWEYHSFMDSPESALSAKQNELTAASDQNEKLRGEIKRMQDFLANLEKKKNDIRGLATELDGMKASLSDRLDIPEFINMTVTEAKKVGLVVQALAPTHNKQEEYYREQTFELKFSGAYIQFLAFLDRISQSQKVIRITNFPIFPKGNAGARYVEIAGSVDIKAYHYLGSKADELVRNPGAGGAPQ